jgi:hypothetical protein
VDEDLADFALPNDPFKHHGVMVKQYLEADASSS